MSCGVLISSVKFSGQTCQVTFLEDGTNQTFLLGEETIPFTFFPADGTPQGKYFIYFSGSDTTYPLVVSGACPTPTPTLTPTNTPTPTVTTGLTPTATETPTITPTPTITKTSGIYNALFTTGSTISNSCFSNDTVTLYFSSPFYTPGQFVFLNSNLTIYAPLGYYTNSGVVYFYNGFSFISQGACPSVTPTGTLTPTPTVTTGLTPTATATNTVTPTVTPTVTKTPTQTITTTPSVTPTKTPTVTPTATKTPTPSVTNTPTVTPTRDFEGCQYYMLVNESDMGSVIYSYINCNGSLVTGNVLPPNPNFNLCAKKNSVVRTGGVDSLVVVDLGICPTPTPTVTATVTKTPTNTQTQTVTPTNTETPTPTQTPTNTETPTVTPTNTETPTQTPTNTETPTQTPTPTNTETPTVTPTNTETPTPTVTETSTQTPTPSVTPSLTPTQTSTQTPTTTSTQTPTNTPNLDGFNYPNFSSISGLELVGSYVTQTSNEIYLTSPTVASTGNLYRSTSVRYNRNFSLEWKSYIGGGSGADGYCIQWTTTNNTNGVGGGGIGRIADSSTINAIGFYTLTFDNFQWWKNNVLQSTESVSSGFWRQVLYFWADYTHSTQTFNLYFNTTNTKPNSPNKQYNSFVFDSTPYYIGFGAATGGAQDYHNIVNWKLTFT